MQPFAPFRDGIKAVGILPYKMYRHHIPPGSHTFHDKRLVPCQVPYAAVFHTPRTNAGRKHDDLVVGTKSILYHLREITRLFPQLIDRYT